MGSLTLKDQLYTYCFTYIEERHHRIREEIARQQADANESTKSSMGDKYETGRAMAQLEIERSRLQLIEAEKLRADLLLIPPAIHKSDSIVPGSLVTTTTSSFYLAISIGPVTIEQRSCFVVSPHSPVGKLLLGKRIGDPFVWNGITHTVLSIE